METKDKVEIVFAILFGIWFIMKLITINIAYRTGEIGFFEKQLLDTIVFLGVWIWGEIKNVHVESGK